MVLRSRVCSITVFAVCELPTGLAVNVGAMPSVTRLSGVDLAV